VAVVSRTQDTKKPGGQDFKDFSAIYPAAKLANQDEVISTLALPYVGKELLQAISKRPDGAEYLPSASYAGDSPYVLTTSIAKSSVGGKDAYAKLHILHNKDTNKTLVVAFRPPSVKLPSDTNVTVVNVADADAQATVKKWISHNIKGKEAETLPAAFTARNTPPPEKIQDKLESWLTDTAIRTYSPTMIDASQRRAGGVSR